MEDIVQFAVENWGATLVAGLSAGFAWLVSKMGAGIARDIIGRALGEVAAAVGEVQQVYVDIIKAGRSDGKLTDEEKAMAKKTAIDIAKSNLGPKGLKRLARAITGAELDGWLASKVESVVSASKK